MKAPHSSAHDKGEASTLRAWVAARLRHDLAHPVQVDEYRNRHRVTAMRGIEITVRRRARAIEVRGRQDPQRGEWLEGNLDLHRPLAGRHWAVAWWVASQTQVPRHLRAEAERCPLEQAVAWINAAAERSDGLPLARRRIIEALQLDPGLWRRARQLCAASSFSSREFNLVWQHARRTRQRCATAGMLWPLYGVALEQRHVRPWADAGAVRAVFRGGGLSPRGWAALCRHGPALWWPLVHCDRYGHAPIDLIATWVNLVVATGRHDVPPPQLALAFGKCQGMVAGVPRADPPMTRILRLAWARMEDMGLRQRSAFAYGPLETVLAWSQRHWGHPNIPRGAGWPWLERTAARERRRANTPPQPVPTFGRRARIAGFFIEPLMNLRQVQEAGFEMRNCMTHVEPWVIKRDREALFLMRDAETHHARAMFGSCIDDICADAVSSIRARCNQTPTMQQRRAALAYLERCIRAGDTRARDKAREAA